MTEIISVRFRNGGKEYYFDPQGAKVKAGDQVIIETASGPEFGVCCRGNTMVPDDKVVQPLRPMLRSAGQRDLANLQRNRELEKKALAVCREKVEQYKLDMALVRCECSFDGKKLLFFFTSENRVDFRALVKDLSATLHCRIELRQIGARDESRLLGGLGLCGRPYCCHGFLEQFHSVSIKMAKTQGLSLNPVKISGPCGRLMCCLKYEQEAYEDAVGRLPKKESFVETPDGAGTVSEVNLLRETVKVRLEDAPEAPQSYAGEEIRVIRSGKGHRPEGYVAPPPEELEKLRTVTPRRVAAPAESGDLSGHISAALSHLDAAPRRGSSSRRSGAGKPTGGSAARTGGGKPPAAGKAKDGAGRSRSHHRGGGRNRPSGK